jgi:hypothetical protein
LSFFLFSFFFGHFKSLEQLSCVSQSALLSFRQFVIKKLNKRSYYTKINLCLSKSRPRQSIRLSRLSNLHYFTISNIALLPSNNLIIRIHHATMLQQWLKSDNQKETTTFIYSTKTSQLLKCFSTNNRGHFEESTSTWGRDLCPLNRWVRC